MFRLFSYLLVIIPIAVSACGLHQSTGLYLQTEPGSLAVVESVVNARMRDALGNANKPEQFRLYLFMRRLAKANPDKISFSLFEAIKGHYRQILLEPKLKIVGRDTRPSQQELLVITELDVLDALASGALSWQQAHAQGLIAINGNAEDVAQLERWFASLFLARA
ncbi:hypothetical protein F9L16_07965 [Agarivorans sp. B2Z047]|uniref:hypothetical protein n=1 Tax=unclassified Agarivorans TaxID=2636026 RepID=UPI00128C2D78|nr:hypothetical protein [Agarivorans sp. B2Z047]MPW28935.1 hypothetical protein [Agarivorans sp. B2Z047]UQN41492.1 hypothetical protein LQZ07_17170 [Agarivorans sp. B2Z047]